MRKAKFICWFNSYLCLFFAMTACSSPEASAIYDLRCEYLTEPLGIDNPYQQTGYTDFQKYSPRVSWKLSEDNGYIGQTAFRIAVSKNSGDLQNGNNILWDSGIIESDKQYCFIPANIIQPNSEYYWRVCVYSKDSTSYAWSKPTRFSTGLSEKDWHGKWIKCPNAAKESHIWFRKDFSLDSKSKPSKTFAYIASAGYHELYVNGSKVGDRALAPAISRLDKRVLYVTYDISNLLNEGQNTIAVNYGPGWSFNNYFAPKTDQGILVQVYGDGTHLSLCSDTTWLCKESYSKNIGRFDFMNMGGELVDGREYTAEWMNPNYDDSQWVNAIEGKSDFRPILSADMSIPSQVIETIPAKSLSEIIGPSAQDNLKRTIYRVDMGKEFTGFLNASFDGLQSGDTIEIMVSMRSDNPEFVQATYGVGNKVIEEQRQKQIYIARGENGETFCNRFNFFAGRYIHFRGLREKPNIQHIKGFAISSSPEVTSTFECSDSLYNQIFELDKYTYQMCNTEGVTVDCPNRERLGYGPEGAYQTMWGVGLPCFNSAAYYVKNVRDWADVQYSDGFINNVAPQISQMYGCALNGTAILNIAWEHYRMYGDKRILELAYPVGQKWLGFLDKHVADSMLTPYDKEGYFLGEWVSPGPVFEYAETKEALFFNNCVYAMALDFMIKIGNELNKNSSDMATIENKLSALRQALHHTYYDPAIGSYLTGDQVRTAFALYSGIVPDSLQGPVKKHLAQQLNKQGYINVGSFGRYPFYKVLLGNPEYMGIIGNILSKTNYPSYGYFVKKGCTTLPEMWEIDQPNSTVIHTSYTGISAVFIKGLAGINESSPGFDTILIEPKPIEHLSWCRAETDTPLGKVKSAWVRRENGKIQYSVTVPPGATAKIRIEGQEEMVLHSGNYNFKY
jgi:alpha-L-rhamnosidase